MNKIIFAIIAIIPLTCLADYGKLDPIPFRTETKENIKIEFKTEKQSNKIQKARIEKLQPKEQETQIRELRGKKITN